MKISKLRGSLRELYDQLFGDNGEERLDELNLWLKGVEITLLRPITSVTIPAIRRFSASEVLGRTGINRDGVPIVFSDCDFLDQFGTMVEENIPATELAVSRLERYADTIEIAGAIPRAKRAVWISQICLLVRDQANGEAGPLLVKRLEHPTAKQWGLQIYHVSSDCSRTYRSICSLVNPGPTERTK